MLAGCSGSVVTLGKDIYAQRKSVHLLDEQTDKEVTNQVFLPVIVWGECQPYDGLMTCSECIHEYLLMTTATDSSTHADNEQE